MASATPSPTPNPNAMKFTLDVRIEGSMNVAGADQADSPFARRVFEAPGVAALFGVNDFVTVTRTEGAAWEPIIEAVQAAAADL